MPPVAERTREYVERRLRLIGRIGAAALALLAAFSLAACQSTKQRSAELEEDGTKVLLADSGLEIGARSDAVRVTSTTLLSDANGTAVVVGLRNVSGQDLADVPILVDVRDAAGKSVYRNDIPGIEPALAHVPFIAAGSEVTWVNDQVLAAGTPKSVRVVVGAEARPYSGPVPEFDVTPPRIEGDPVSGIEAAGHVVNRSGVEQERLLLYAVARRGDRVVAAGRGALEQLKATTKPRHYDIFFIGDPQGAQVELTEFPTLAGIPAR